MKKNKQNQWKSACLIGSCAEISKNSNKIKLRNSSQPERIVEFSQEEWEELRTAFVENRF